MKQPFHSLRTALAGIVLSAAAFHVQAGTYEQGLIAYSAGNYVEAGQHLMIAAEKGAPGAEHMLMRLFSEGHLSALDSEKEILKWTRKAADNGIMQAQFALGEIYARHPDTVKDAVTWYRKAAEQGHPDALYRLGEILSTGAEGIAANAEESSHMYQIAASEYLVYAQMGNPEYQYSLGSMYRHARGVEKNMTTALKWISKSAMQGHARAQLALGRIYAKGIDVPRDDRQARYWLDMAAAQGHDEAVAALEQLNNDAAVALIM